MNQFKAAAKPHMLISPHTIQNTDKPIKTPTYTMHGVNAISTPILVVLIVLIALGLVLAGYLITDLKREKRANMKTNQNTVLMHVVVGLMAFAMIVCPVIAMTGAKTSFVDAKAVDKAYGISDLSVHDALNYGFSNNTNRVRMPKDGKTDEYSTSFKDSNGKTHKGTLTVNNRQLRIKADKRS